MSADLLVPVLVSSSDTWEAMYRLERSQREALESRLDSLGVVFRDGAPDNLLERKTEEGKETEDEGEETEDEGEDIDNSVELDVVVTAIPESSHSEFASV